MGLRVNNNIPALNAGRQARRANNQLTENLRQLGSGLRINRAADDAAGLAIADRFNTLVRQGQVEINNLQSGINVAQTADSGLSTQQDAVSRIRELAVQAGNGTLTDAQRGALNQEAQQLIEQINTTASDTEFNGQQLLSEDQTISLGTEGENQIELQGSTAADLGLDTLDLSTAAGAAAALEATDAASAQISANRANIGAQSNRFESAIEQRSVAVQNQQESESNIRDLDVARGVIERTRNQVLLQASIGSIVQSNVTPQSALRLLGT